MTIEAPQGLVQGFATEQQKVVAEIREIDLLVESTQTEVNRLRAREEQARAKLDEARTNPSAFQPQDVVTSADEHSAAIGRRMTMEGQLTALQAKRKLLDRVQALLSQARQQLEEQAQAEPPPAPAAAAVAVPQPVDESRVLQAVVATQEEERRRLARAVHDGPAQAMANVVLQSEISERLYDVDPQRSRNELAALRQMVNKTLQELRAFIFELRPMILDDLGLVPTLRRYIQTLVDKHGIHLDFSSTGRDRRLGSEEEVAIFRLIQDSLVERIEQAGAKSISLGMEWRDQTLELVLQSDGKQLSTDSELTSGLRRSERLSLLKGRAQEESRENGTIVLQVSLPIRPAPQLIG